MYKINNSDDTKRTLEVAARMVESIKVNGETLTINICDDGWADLYVSKIEDEKYTLTAPYNESDNYCLTKKQLITIAQLGGWYFTDDLAGS